MAGDGIEDFLAGLRPDVVIEGVGAPRRALSISEALAIRSWFDAERQRFVSTGGRPTRPEWSLKRQIPLAESTWQTLKDRAARLSRPGSNVAPAQLAAMLLESAVSRLEHALDSPTEPDHASRRALDELPDDLRNWKMPPVFGLAEVA